MCENENVILKVSSETSTPMKMARSMSIKMQFRLYLVPSIDGSFLLTNLALMVVPMRWLLTVVV